MTDRVHIRNGQIIRKYNGERGRVALENGRVAMPVVLGYTNGNDVIVPYVTLTNDTSTGTDTVTTKDVVIGTDEVTETTTIRDKTPTEIADALEDDQQSALSDLDRQNSIIKAFGGIIFQLSNDVRTLKGQGTITPDQFRNHVKSKL